jgi:cysteine desulfurase
MVASPVEHPSVVEPVRRLACAGFEVDWLPVDEWGVVRTKALSAVLRADTRVVAVQLANHETGAVHDVRGMVDGIPCLRCGLGDRKEGPGVAVHCDAVQAVGRMPVRFHELGVTSLSLSAHKFHGPKGVGALLLRRGVKLRAQLTGGHQQQGRRPGTEPVALAVGLVAALELAHHEADHRRACVTQLRKRFLNVLRAAIEPVVLNGAADGGVAHTLNLSFPGCRADALLMNLDLVGVACSTGSACSSGSLLPSPVLQAMGVSAERLGSAMRFSLSPMLTESEVEEAARRIASVVLRLRSIEAAD